MFYEHGLQLHGNKTQYHLHGAFIYMLHHLKLTDQCWSSLFEHTVTLNKFMLGEMKFCCLTGPVPVVLSSMFWSASGLHVVWIILILRVYILHFSSSLDSLAPPVAWPDFQLLSHLSSNALILFYSNSVLVFASDDTDIHIEAMGVLLTLQIHGPLCSLFPLQLPAPRLLCALRMESLTHEDSFK